MGRGVGRKMSGMRCLSLMGMNEQQLACLSRGPSWTELDGDLSHTL